MMTLDIYALLFQYAAAAAADAIGAQPSLAVSGGPFVFNRLLQSQRQKGFGW